MTYLVDHQNYENEIMDRWGAEMFTSRANQIGNFGNNVCQSESELMLEDYLDNDLCHYIQTKEDINN